MYIFHLYFILRSIEIEKLFYNNHIDFLSIHTSACGHKILKHTFPSFDPVTPLVTYIYDYLQNFRSNSFVKSYNKNMTNITKILDKRSSRWFHAFGNFRIYFSLISMTSLISPYCYLQVKDTKQAQNLICKLYFMVRKMKDPGSVILVHIDLYLHFIKL